MKKYVIILIFLPFLFISCGDKEPGIYETLVSDVKIEFPFKEIDNGKFVNIFNNSGSELVSISVVMLSNGVVILDSQSKDFCEGVLALRDGKNIAEWIVINHNFSVIPSKEILNENDHPNLISYSLPMGTYMVMLMDEEPCNKNKYVIFDVKTNDGIQVPN